MTETKKIRIKKVFKAEGNKPHVLIGWDGSKYFSFVSMHGLIEIAKGQEVELDVEQKPDYQGVHQYEIKKVYASPLASKEEEKVPPASPPRVSQAPLFDIEQNIKEAEKLAKKLYGENVMDYDGGITLITEIAHQRFALYMEEKIQANKLKNMGAI